MAKKIGKTTKGVEKNKNPEEEHMLISLRATTWNEFSGQESVKKHLHIAIEAAKKRREAVEHILLYGPPGLGKTTLAHLIAKEMGVNIRITSGPAIERSGDLASILTNLQQNDILFIDEIHRLNKVVEETLYPAMEERALDIVIGKGPSARTLRLDLPQFTIVGATTRVGLLSSPMRDRFGVITRLSFYSPGDIEEILENASRKLSIELDKRAKKELAARSRGTPRIALRLLKRVRDVAQVEGDGTINSDILDKSLHMLGVDTMGLDSSDQRYLLTVIEKFEGGPVGVDTIASALSEDIGTLEDVVEPYLIQIGFIKRTNRGRVVTHLAFSHFGKQTPITPHQLPF